MSGKIKNSKKVETDSLIEAGPPDNAVEPIFEGKCAWDEASWY